jgi:hypothetical protein
MVDTKVQVWTKFSKNNLWKKVKSPLSMNFWRIRTSKCRGKLQKMGCCTPILPKALAHLPNFQKFLFFKLKNFKKMWIVPQAQVLTRGQRATRGRQPALGRWPVGGDQRSPGCRRLVVGAWSRPGDQAPTVGHRQSGDQWSLAGRRSTPGHVGQFPFFLNFFFFLPSTFCPSNSCWLAPVHARPTQTSPWNFKHP